MPVYRVMRDYVGLIEGTRYGLEAGALIDLDRGAATLINVERPDTLWRLPEERGGETVPDGPPATRQIVRASKRKERAA